MTVISDQVTDLAGLGETDSIVFETFVIRDNKAGTAIVNTRRHKYAPDEDGTFTTDDLDPGPARVTLGVGGSAYDITIPDDDNEIRLMPLIEAGLPVPAVEEAAAVRNLGGVDGIRRVTQAWYDTQPHDPATLYIVVSE